MRPDGPADQAGVRVSDVIVSVNNDRITNDRELFSEVAGLKVGTEVPFTVMREGLEQTVFINVAERPHLESHAQPAPSSNHRDSTARIGISVTDMVPPGPPSVVVTEVVPGSAAARAGLKRGDVIKAVGSQEVKTVHEFVHQVSKTKGDIALLVQRSGLITYMVIKPG